MMARWRGSLWTPTLPSWWAWAAGGSTPSTLWTPGWTPAASSGESGGVRGSQGRGHWVRGRGHWVGPRHSKQLFLELKNRIKIDVLWSSCLAFLYLGLREIICRNCWQCLALKKTFLKFKQCYRQSLILHHSAGVRLLRPRLPSTRSRVTRTSPWSVSKK